MVRPPRTFRAIGRNTAIALAIAAVAGCDRLSKIEGTATPEQICSSQDTYDALTGVMAAQAGSAASLLGANRLIATASSTASIRNVLNYSSPTVDDINKGTGKVSCKALLRVDTPTAMLTDQRGLSPNDFGPDHVTYAIEYSVQPTADQGKPLVTLSDAAALSSVAFQAALINAKRTQDAASQTAAPPPEPEDDSAADQPEPSADEGQAATDRTNVMDDASRTAPDADGAGENEGADVQDSH